MSRSDTKRTATAALRRGGLRALSETVATLTETTCARRGFDGNVLIARWPEIVGKHLAAGSAPERLVFPPGKRAGATLHLRIASGGLATELQHLQPILLERINVVFGYNAVTRLRFVQAPLPPRPIHRSPPARTLSKQAEKELEEQLADIPPSSLRDALYSLGKQMMSRNEPAAETGQPRSPSPANTTSPLSPERSRLK